MENKEVIENLQYLISEDCTDTQVDYVKEIKMAICALEKRIPKKVFYNDLFKQYECPSCHKKREHRDLSYCGLCGQCLDWSDTPLISLDWSDAK